MAKENWIGQGGGWVGRGAAWEQAGGGEGGEVALRAVIQHTSRGEGGGVEPAVHKQYHFSNVALPGTCLLAPVAWHTAT